MQRHVLGASKSIKDGARGGEEKKIIASHHLNVALAAIDNFYRSSATRHGR